MESLTFQKENEEDVEKCNADENLNTIIKENRTNETTFGLVFNYKLVLCEKNNISHLRSIYLFFQSVDD